MDFALSTHLFVRERLNSHVLDRIVAAGLNRIEIFAARQHLDYRDGNQVRDVAEWFSDHGASLHSVHAPLFADMNWGRLGGLAVSVADLEKRRRVESMDEIKRALEIAEAMPFRYLIVHLGLDGEEFDPRKFDAAFSSLEYLKIFAKDRGVHILLENYPNGLSTAERLLDFIRYTKLDLKVCFDTGHAHMAEGVQSAFQKLREHIASTHIHDNNRFKDDHLLPFEGQIDWEKTVRDFRSAPGQVPFLFELKNYGDDSSDLARLRKVMERLEALDREA
ncbi:MAG: sugar phosphate isomerase/epimerase [Nitrospirae bacterium]|nr:MAG: sugar phosphate isomerase/epimerase [Nitrospirota bacterium]